MPDEFELSVVGMPDSNNEVVAYGGPVLTDYEFTALGDYRFIVRETASADPINYPIDDEKEYYFYVSVRNKLENGQPTGEYIATMAAQVKDHDTGDKVYPVFESDATRSRVKVTKTVSGNLANTNEFFKFRVVIDGAHEGDVFSVYGQSDVVNYGGESITTSSAITIDADEDYIYLKDGQTVWIGFDGDKEELPIGLRYSLEEVDNNGYVQYVDGVAGSLSETKTVVADEESLSNVVEFLNHKEGSILTGIVINVMPYVFAVAFTGIALAIIHTNRKKQRKTKCLK